MKSNRKWLENGAMGIDRVTDGGRGCSRRDRKCTREGTGNTSEVTSRCNTGNAAQGADERRQNGSSTKEGRVGRSAS